MDKGWSEFVHRENVANYRRLLRDVPDSAREQVLVTLLGEEATAARANGWPLLAG